MSLDVSLPVSWTQVAREDLLQIYVLIGLEQPAAAERYFDRIENKAWLLSQQPRLGVRRPHIRPGFRMLVENPYVILYRTIPDADDGPLSGVQIVRVVDGRQDLAGQIYP
jgi:toxin ParE1/3/4